MRLHRGFHGEIWGKKLCGRWRDGGWQAGISSLNEYTYSMNIIPVYEMSRNVRKHTFWHVRPAKTQISLHTRRTCSDCLLSVWRNLASLAIQNTPNEDSDQPVRSKSSPGAHVRWYVSWRCGSNVYRLIILEVNHSFNIGYYNSTWQVSENPSSII